MDHEKNTALHKTTRFLLYQTTIRIKIANPKEQTIAGCPVTGDCLFYTTYTLARFSSALKSMKTE